MHLFIEQHFINTLMSLENGKVLKGTRAKIVLSIRPSVFGRMLAVICAHCIHSVNSEVTAASETN